MKKPTIADVARETALSRATISLVLADSPQIPDRTKERVRAKMAEMGYVYNRLAGMVRGGRSHTIGLVLTNIRNPYFAELTMSIDAAVRDAGYTLLQGYSFGDTERELSLIRVMNENRVDGLIVLPATDTDEAACPRQSDTGMINTITLLREPPHDDIDFVGVAEAKSGTILGKHLASRAVRTAAFLGGMKGSHIRNARLSGLREGLGSAAALPDNRVIPVPHADYDLSEAGRLVDHLLDQSSLPDAIVAYNDSWAGGIYQSLREHGITPGADVAVASFDNIPSSQQLYPGLTTIDTSPWEVGQNAVRLLFSRIDTPGKPAERVLISPKLVARDSTLFWSAHESTGIVQRSAIFSGESPRE